MTAAESLPPPSETTVDPQRQIAARAYARDRYRTLLLTMVLSLILVAGFLLSGASLWLKTALVSFLGLETPLLGGGQMVLVAAYVTLAFLPYTIVMLPLSWWSGFVLPHRYGQSTQTWRGWVSDEAKSLSLGVVMGIPIALLIYWLLGNAGTAWWIWASVALIALSVLMDFVAPMLLLPLFYKLTLLHDASLAERIRLLGARTGVRVAGVYTIDLSSRTKAANAMVMGLGRTKRIALGDTLCSAFTPDEIETVIAHELGHQVHRDLELGLATQALLIPGGMLVASLFLQWGTGRFGFTGADDIAALPLLALSVALFSAITMPLGNTYSRWRERLADTFAIQVTGKPHAFAGAMTRLANQNLADVDPPRWLVLLLYTHPPIKERLALAHSLTSSP